MWHDNVKEAEKKISESLKGQSAGEKHWGNKYSEKQAKEVINLLLNRVDLSYSKIANITKTSETFVKNIRGGYHWKYLEKDNKEIL